MSICDVTGEIQKEAGGDPTADLLFPLFPTLPGQTLKVHDTFENTASLSVPVLGPIDVVRQGALTKIGPEDTKPSMGFEFELGARGVENLPETFLGLPLELESAEVTGNEDLQLQGGSGAIDSRKFRFDIRARLAARMSEGGVQVTPVRLHIRFDHSLKPIR